MNTLPVEVVIVGGGIAGLSAAWYLQKEASERGLNVHFTVLEQSNRWGGKIQTEQVDGFGESPFIMEAGPDAFLTRKPWALALARELGLNERILGVNRAKIQTYVVHRGQPVPLPEGLQLLVPTKIMPFLRSPLFSIWGKIRVGSEPFIPRRADTSDETLASFVRRRLGVEVLDKLAEPLLSGVYNADPEYQSMLATFPQFPVMEQKHGSLLRAVRESHAEKPADSSPSFISFETGAHELVGALVTQLTGDLWLSTKVQSIQSSAEGVYTLTLNEGRPLHADAVILSVPAKAAASLLTDAAPQAANRLSEMRSASIGAVYLGFRAQDVTHPLDGFGVVIPSSEKRGIDGMTWISSKWTHRAPDGHVLLRVFFGGPHTRAAMDMDDTALVDMVRDEVRSLLQISAPPLFHKIFRWPDGYPQYDLGHLERVAAIESALPPGIFVAGSSYRGIGVPDCIKQGQAAAQQVISALLERQSAPQPAM
ncbi:MAG: protoporphyrinogen oxidase [Chloroflexota bacterium]